jgi:hypothetical protein
MLEVVIGDCDDGLLLLSGPYGKTAFFFDAIATGSAHTH